MTIPDLALHHSEVTVSMAERLCAGIPGDRFARIPEGVHTNHPAFALSHLLIYPDRSIFAMLGSPELARPYERYAEIANAGVELRDDPDGSIYPPKDELLAALVDRYGAAGAAAAATPAEVFERENPNERMRERFPTIGSAVVFLLGAHAMLHLGQISAFRRIIGLGSAL